MASGVYNRGKQILAESSLDWDGSDTVRIALLKTVSNGFDASHNFVSDAIDGTNNVEADATNYSRKTLSSAAVTEDDANNRSEMDAGDVTWNSLGGTTDNTIRAAVIYKQVGGDDSTPGDDPVIAYIDLADTTTNGGDFTIQWDSEGIIQVS